MQNGQKQNQMIAYLDLAPPPYLLGFNIPVNGAPVVSSEKLLMHELGQIVTADKSFKINMLAHDVVLRWCATMTHPGDNKAQLANPESLALPTLCPKSNSILDAPDQT